MKALTLSVETLPPNGADWPVQGEWTYDDYLRLPDDGRRYEIIEGVLYVANAPSFDHQYAVTKVSSRLEQHVAEYDLGYVLSAPFEIHLSKRSRPVQPDVFFVASERWPAAAGSQIFEGAPDLIVEVLSPSSYRRDTNIKFTAYEAAGVREYWIVNTNARLVQLYTLSSGEYALLGEFVGDEAVESRVLPGLELVTSALFP